MADVEIVIKVEGIKKARIALRKATRRVGMLYLVMAGWPRWLAWLVCRCLPYTLTNKIINYYHSHEAGNGY